MSDTVTDFRTRFTEAEKTFAKISYPVWSGGSGPPVILMHELDGFAEHFIRLALRLSEQFTVHAPVLYGQVGQVLPGKIGGLRASYCVRREFHLLRVGKTSPVVAWVRGLASEIWEQAPGDLGVGVVGMCLTGGIVLATIAHPAVAAGVAAQPSLPFPLGRERAKKDLGMDPADVQAAAQSDTPVLVLRYGADTTCPAARISSIRCLLPSAEGPPSFLEGIDSHPTLTDKYRDDVLPAVQEVSERAIMETMAFLRKHLGS